MSIEANQVGIDPFGDRILVKQDEVPKEKKVGSILVAGREVKAPNYGTIIKMGTGKLVNAQLQQGWRVIFAPYSATEIEIECEGKTEKFFIMEPGAVLAVFVSK